MAQAFKEVEKRKRNLLNQIIEGSGLLSNGNSSVSNDHALVPKQNFLKETDEVEQEEEEEEEDYSDHDHYADESDSNPNFQSK